MEALEEPGHRGLAGAAPAHDAERRAGGRVEGDAVERRAVRSLVAEGHVGESDPTLERHPDAVFRAPFLGRLVDELRDDGDGDPGLVVLVDQARRLEEWRGDPLGEHQEREQRADIDRVLGAQRQIDADGKRPGHRQPLDRPRHRLDEVGGQALGIAELPDLGGLDVPEVAVARIEGERLDGADAVDRLDEERPALQLRRLDRCRPAAVERQHDDQPEHHQPAHRQDAERHDRAEEEHHRKEDEERRRIEDGAEELAEQERPDLPELMDVVGDPADLGPLEEVHRQAEELVEDVGAEPDVDARGQVDDEEVAHIAEDRVEDDEHDEREAEHEEGVVGVVVEHLVGEQAPEDDRRQGEEPEDHGADRHVAHDPFLAEDQPGDEADAERPFLVGDRVVALDQDDLAGPGVLEADAVDGHRRAAVQRILKGEARRVGATLDPGEHHAASALQPDDRRQNPSEVTDPAGSEPHRVALSPAERAHLTRSAPETSPAGSRLSRTSWVGVR